jgi:tetratricopeptide (TPR) repeat protein/O-antigen ligase
MRSSVNLSYLAKETGLILVFSYLVLVGGGYVGLVAFESRLTTHLLVAVIVAVWLAQKVLANEGFPRTSLDLPMTAFVVVLVLATVLSDMPTLSLEGVTWVLSYVVLFYVVIDLLRRGWPAELFLKSLLVVGGIACLLALLEALHWYLGWVAVAGLDDPLPPSLFRIVSTLGPNPLAAYLNLLIPFAAVAAVGKKRRTDRFVLVSWLLLALVVQSLTLSRGGWLGLFAVAATLAVTITLQYRSRLPAKELRGRLVKNKLLTSALIAVMVVAFLLICLVGYRLLTIPSRQGSLEERFLMWRSGWMAFVESPATGTGPWTYGTQFLRYSQTDLRRPVEKAHNVGLTILAESGVLGLATSLWLFGSVISGLRQRWLNGNQNHRLLVGACLASIVGTLAHGMVEDFLSFPFFTLTLAVVVATALGGAQPRERGLRRRVSCRWLVAPLLVLFLAMFWSDIGYFYFSRGARLATDGEWEAAVPLVERATDLYPGFPFYHFQLGFIYGTLASEDGSPNLDLAIEEYEAGLSEEPYYSVNHANLAALYWQDGRTDLAIEHMKEAMKLAPLAARHAIQLGGYHEQLGSEASATGLYRQAIDLDPSLIKDLFWDGSAWRQGFIEPYREGAIGGSASLRPGPGQLALQEGRYAEAAEHFEMVLSTQPGNATAHTRLGVAYLALGNEDAGTHHLRVAIFLGSSRTPHLALGRLAYERGDLPEAIAEFEAALIRPLYSDFYGPGVYRREGIYQSRLPQLPHLGLTATLAEDYLQLAEMYEEAEAPDQARSIYLMLLEYVPDHQPALAKLESLGDAPAGN